MGLRKLLTRLWPRDQTEHWYRVTPAYRHSWEHLFHLEDPKNAQTFDEHYATRLSEQNQHFNNEIARIGRNVTYADALLLFMVASKGNLPDVYGLPLASLFFAAEALVIWSSIGFAFLSIAFINHQAYEALLRQWCAHRNPQDPEYLLASYVPVQLTLRIVRPRLSTPFGADRLRSGRAYTAANRFVLIGVIWLSLAFVLTHFGIIGMAISKILLTQNLGWWATVAVVASALASNLFGFLLVIVTTVLPMPVRLIDMRYPDQNSPSRSEKESSGYNMNSIPLVEEGDAPPNSPIGEMEGNISKAVGALSKEQQIRALTRALAYAQLATKFERIYRDIFGSQIKGLRRLDTLTEVPLINAREFYELEASARYPEAYKDASFEKWISYLVVEDLVLVLKENVSITDTGREFLRFIDSRRYTEDRSL